MEKKPENIQSTLTALIGIVSIVSVQNLLLAFECSWLKKMTAAEREGTKSRREAKHVKESRGEEGNGSLLSRLCILSLVPFFRLPFSYSQQFTAN